MRRLAFALWLAGVCFPSVGLLASLPAQSAALEISGIFTDHMVMQRSMKVPVWGWAEPGEEITVAIDQQTKTAKVDQVGKWMVHLDPMETGAPRTMTIRGKSGSLEIKDILLGEVWIASGQSNMQWSLSQTQDAAREIETANLPDIRLFNMVRGGANASKEGPARQLVDGLRNSKPYRESWQICAPASVKDDFSAVAFSFGRDLQAKLHVPIGLISNPVGGSAIEMWISRAALLADPDYKVVPQYFDRLVEFSATPAGQKEVAANFADYEAKQQEARAQGKPPLWPLHHSGAPKRDAFTSVWFNSRVHPLIPFAIRGVIWYQGEANGYRAGDLKNDYPRDYQGMFQLLIKDWRDLWGQGNFPFLFVQLPNWAAPSPDANSTSGWTVIRDAQLKTLSVPNTAMAVTIDVGDAASIHPTNKQPVGSRLALAARAIAYGEKLVYSGPIFREMKLEGKSIRLFFDHVGSGLEARGGELKQFAIAGEDKKFVWADAVIDQNTVVVSSAAVPVPVQVRYAAATNPVGCNLYNKEGLPASPFQTGDRPAIEKGAYYKAKMKEPPSLRPAKP